MSDALDFILDPQLAPPQSALDFTSILLLDTLGVCAGAVDMAAGQIARDCAVALYGAGEAANQAPILFDGRAASLAGAAFAAASQIDNLDAHDGYNPTKGHIGCAVVPALFAFASQRPDLSGPEALTALAMSYEVAARAAISLHATVEDYHTSGAWNALGVAALGARLRGASQNTLRHALGIAEYHGPRSQMMREIATPTMLHDGSGMGALVGVSALVMAEQSFLGAPAITVEADEVVPHWADLGQNWTVELNYIKPYPICRWAHAAIDAARALRLTHDIAPEGIAQVDIATFQQAACLYRGTPRTTSEAQYALTYPVAVMLLKGQICPDDVAEAALGDPEVAALSARITVTESPRHSSRFPDGRWSDLTITLRDGTTYHSGDVHARGGPEAPMSASDIEDKFMMMAAPKLGDARARAIWQAGWQLTDPDSRFADLVALVIRQVTKAT